MIYKENNKVMKHVKLFENWMEDEDNDQTAYVDTPRMVEPFPRNCYRVEDD